MPAVVDGEASRANTLIGFESTRLQVHARDRLDTSLTMSHLNGYHFTTRSSDELITEERQTIWNIFETNMRNL